MCSAKQWQSYTKLLVAKDCIIRQWKQNLCVCMKERCPLGGCNGTPLEESQAPGFIGSCQVCFHQDEAFYTRHTHRHNICQSASVCLSLSILLLLVQTRPCTHTLLSSPSLHSVLHFFPSINSVTPSSGPWHYRKTEHGKEGDCGEKGEWVEGNQERNIAEKEGESKRERFRERVIRAEA